MEDKKMNMWYNKPANAWLEYLPVGNGRLGAMISGGVSKEILQLNEDSIWYGGPAERVNPDAKETIKKLQTMIMDGKVWEAEQLAFLGMTSTPDSQRHYQTAGELLIEYPNLSEDFSAYTRELDLSQSLVRSSFVCNGVLYEKECFASFPDQLIAYKIKADKKRSVSLKVRLARGRYLDYCDRDGQDTIIIGGTNGGKDAIDFTVAAKAKAKGGKVYVLGQFLFVEDADEAEIYLSMATTFYNSHAKEAALRAYNVLQSKSYETIKKDHINDYKSIYDHMHFTLGSQEEMDSLDSKPTDERLQSILNGSEDVPFNTLYFQYGRYLLISSSRKNSLPANLRGIWNNEFDPPWDSKFTININIEMIYWAAEICNMQACIEPLFDLIERMRVRGRKVAQDMYGCKGFVAHHNTDLWADCAPQDIHRAAFWSLGAVWICFHLWDYYDYSRDVAFLKKAYPTMKEAAAFVLDYLMEDKDGFLVTCPSHSPENSYYLEGRRDVKPSMTYGPTSDNMIISYYFKRILESADILGIQDDFVEDIKAALKRIHPIRIGKHGQIQEWVKDYDEPEPGHRHTTQLIAFHPANDITLRGTPELATAVKRTLERKIEFGETASEGWAIAWKAIYGARLEDIPMAEEFLNMNYVRATAPNLFGLCVTKDLFVMDGNLGGVTAIAEMLLQSHADELSLLPCLIPSWKEGDIKGLRARGNYTVDMKWHDAKLDKSSIYAGKDGLCRVRGKYPIMVQDVVYRQLEACVIEFTVQKGKTYTIVHKR